MISIKKNRKKNEKEQQRGGERFCKMITKREREKDGAKNIE